MEIEIIPISVKTQKVIDSRKCYVNLFPTYGEYVIDFKCQQLMDETDPHSAWEERFVVQSMFFRKEYVSAVGVCFSYNAEAWMLSVDINGTNYDMKIFYSKRKEAEEVCETIKKMGF